MAVDIYKVMKHGLGEWPEALGCLGQRVKSIVTLSYSLISIRHVVTPGITKLVEFELRRLAMDAELPGDHEENLIGHPMNRSGHCCAGAGCR